MHEGDQPDALADLRDADVLAANTWLRFTFCPLKQIRPQPVTVLIIVHGKTGPSGVTGDQTIRVSVLNAGARGGICPCTFRVFDTSGNVLAQDDTRMPLAPGAGTFVDFSDASSTARTLGGHANA